MWPKAAYAIRFPRGVSRAQTSALSAKRVRLPFPGEAVGALLEG
jgi:hypothetical protein